MIFKKYLDEMIQLQQKLNDETNGIGWENGYTKNGKLINWKRCIYMECAELIDSFNWKHWKDINKPIDWENIKVEIVDIWHFILSLGLEIYKNTNKTKEDLSKDIYESLHFKEFIQDPKNVDDNAQFEIMNLTEHIIHLATLKENNFYEILDDYIALSLMCGINLESLYKYYIAKNILNKFRQEHGYKEGTYKKTWNGKEDNEVMLEILQENDFIDSNTLYEKLEKIYSKVK